MTTPDAAGAILADRMEVLQARELRYGMRRVLGRFVDVKAVDGVLNISWNTDQLHRLGAGHEPDHGRGRQATTVAMLRRNGATSMRPKRGLR